MSVVRFLHFKIYVKCIYSEKEVQSRAGYHHPVAVQEQDSSKYHPNHAFFTFLPVEGAEISSTEEEEQEDATT